MRRVRYHSHGGPEVLAVEEADVPEPGPGQALIRTEAIGVNYVDVQIRRETAPDSIYYRPVPATLTGDVVGTVLDVGSGASQGLVGSRVAVSLEDAYADYVVADASWLADVPSGLSAAEGAMLPTVGAVALGALRTGRPGEGEVVLVTAGAGAVGHLAVQLARLHGAGAVIAAAGSPAKVGFLMELGADVAVNYSQPGWADEVRYAAPGGVNVILEAVGGQVLHSSLELLAPFGRAVVFGASAGDMTSVPVMSLLGLKTMSGFSLLAWRALNPAQARADTAKLTELFGTGALRAATQTLPLGEAAAAHRLLEQRAVAGRIVLVP